MEQSNPTNQPQTDISAVPVLDTKVQRKSHFDKLAEVFLPEDLESIGNKIVSNVIIPNILKTAGDILHRSIDMVFGTNFTGVNSSQSSTVPVRNYTTYGNNASYSQPSGSMQILPIRRGVYDYSIVKFRTVEDAQNVFRNMQAVLNNTGRVSVGKYLEYAHAETIKEDYNYGWTKLDNVYVERTDYSDYPFKLNLPPAVALNQVSERYYL